MLSADYIVGLTDGEGCFYVHVRPHQSNSLQPRVDTHFYIKLHEDEKDLLEKVKESFGCGAVYAQKETRRNHSQCYRFEINAKKRYSWCCDTIFSKTPVTISKTKKL